MDVFETFYEADWGKRARQLRDQRRDDVSVIVGTSAVVRGVVDHPLWGKGYEVFYRKSEGRGISDVRVTREGMFVQTPPRRVETEERWEAMPPSASKRFAWA